MALSGSGSEAPMPLFINEDMKEGIWYRKLTNKIGCVAGLGSLIKADKLKRKPFNFIFVAALVDFGWTLKRMICFY